jgi:hypothetical protein
MGTYYIQVDTLAGALALMAANTRAGHYASNLSNIGFTLGCISYSATTQNTFIYAKQLTYSGTPPVATGYNGTVRFDDVPEERLSHVECHNLFLDKEFISTNYSNWIGLGSLFLNASKLNTSTFGYLNTFSAGAQTKPADDERPYISACVTGVVYYELTFDPIGNYPTTTLHYYTYKTIISGNEGYYCHRVWPVSENTSVSGTYIHTLAVTGPPGESIVGPAGPQGEIGPIGPQGEAGPAGATPDLTVIETALSKLSNLDKLQKYDDMLVKFDNFGKIVNALCAFMSNSERLPESLIFTGEYKNADNIVTKNINTDLTPLINKLNELFTDTIEGETVKIGHLPETFLKIFDEYVKYDQQAGLFGIIISVIAKLGELLPPPTPAPPPEGGV